MKSISRNFELPFYFDNYLEISYVELLRIVRLERNVANFVDFYDS